MTEGNMGLQSKIQELTARFASDLVAAFRSATLEDIRALCADPVERYETFTEYQIRITGKATALTDDTPPKRAPRRKRSWRRMKRYR